MHKYKIVVTPDQLDIIKDACNQYFTFYTARMGSQEIVSDSEGLYSLRLLNSETVNPDLAHEISQTIERFLVSEHNMSTDVHDPEPFVQAPNVAHTTDQPLPIILPLQVRI